MITTKCPEHSHENHGGNCGWQEPTHQSYREGLGYPQAHGVAEVRGDLFGDRVKERIPLFQP
jgi:hypothetical protein